MSQTTLYYGAPAEEKTFQAYLVIGERSLLSNANEALWKSFKNAQVQPPDVVVDGKVDSMTTWSKNGDSLVQYIFVHLSKDRSRNMGAVRSDLVYDLVSGQTPKEGDVKIVLVLENNEQVFPAGCAVARAFPLFSKKASTLKLKARNVHVEFVVPDGVSQDVYKRLNIVAKSIRLSARLVETPCGDLNTLAYISEVKSAVSNCPTVKVEIISGTELADKGYGGLWGVGKAAENPPALVVLTHTPEKVTKEARAVFVGKGIVYDTGGLSLKISGNMVGMKEDMGGSAACLGAFLAAVESGYEGVLSAVLCLAENAVGSKAQRPDDIITMYSGKTVEVNNTDAEGRLVLGDGIAHATRHLNPTHVIDIATLTGAQLITTGKKHAGVLSRNDDFERVVLDAGKRSGDWCFPLLYAPEILKKEFDSKIADMKNSVADRMNAQSSCAGHFVEEHISPEWNGKWAHVDMAGPCGGKDKRATGFGVALLYTVLDLLG